MNYCSVIKINRLLLIFLIAISNRSFAAGDWARYKGICSEDGTENHKTEVIADFDGNGTRDIARLEQNVVTKAVRVAVWMNKSLSPSIAFESNEDIGQALNLLAMPRTTPNFFEEKKIKKYPALIYSSCAIFDAYFFWDAASKKFLSVWDWN